MLITDFFCCFFAWDLWFQIKTTQIHRCLNCDALWTRRWDYERHVSKCRDTTKRRFISGQFKVQVDLFQLLDSLGIVVPAPLRKYPYMISWDCESLLIREVDVSDTTNTRYTMRHEVVSISVATNVPGFETRCFMRDETLSTLDLVETFIDYIVEISEWPIRWQTTWSQIWPIHGPNTCNWWA